jgi:carboxymethylenebutenolidase
VCHEQTARPPLPPIAGGAGVGTTDGVLEAADGNRFAAFTALTDAPGAAAMVVLPDVRGLHPFYRALAVRLAEAGIHATVLDYFGRTAGTAPRGDHFDFMSHVKQTAPDTIAVDVAAAVAHVRTKEGGSARSVFTMGFCFGGRKSFNQAVEGHGLAGVIGFYGRVAPADGADTDAPLMVASGYRSPVLGMFGGADAGIPADTVRDFGRALDDAGVGNELVTYDGAPHSFFDRTFDQHREACDDAWRRVLAFVGRNG